jgi:ribosomal-protein-alanine N-acetyltransferase
MLTIQFNGQFPIIKTDRLVIRKITHDDVSEVFFLRSDKELIKYLDRAPMETMEEAFEYIKKGNESFTENDAINWGIQLKDDNKLIGTIGFWRIDKPHHRAEVGYAIHTDHQGKGLMNEALQAVIEYGFHALGFHSIEANINPHNHASSRLLLKNNFVKEAHFKENYYFNGKFYDSVIYSLITPVK